MDNSYEGILKDVKECQLRVNAWIENPDFLLKSTIIAVIETMEAYQKAMVRLRAIGEKR